MILFLKDWDNYPTAIMHMSTKNQSWVRLARVYREMGIENHAFLLALVNPALEFVDPHSPDLTLQQMAMIAHECKINPWYFFREVAKAPSQGSDDGVMVEANRGNIALWWCFFNHLTTFLIQIRQTGKSFCTDLLMEFLLNIGCVNTKINLITKDDDLRRENIKRMKLIADDLPSYLDQRTRDDANNGEEITVSRLKNSYNTHVPQASPKRANNLGRGLTTAILHWDEPPFQTNIGISLPAAMAATTAATDQAKANGGYYGTILTTTAGKKDDRDGKYIYDMLMDSALWTEMLFDCEGAEELEKVVRRSARKGEYQVNITMNHTQLGKSDEWLFDAMQRVKAVGEAADRDYFNIWTSGSQSSPLGTSTANLIRSSEMQEQFVDISKPAAYTTRWYIAEEEINERLENGQFVLGMDPSEASGGDDISMVILDVETGEVVAAGTYNETNLLTYAEWVCMILVCYPSITAIIERRSMGAMLIDVLLRMLPTYDIDPFKRLFNRVVNDQEEFEERFKAIQVPLGRRDPGLLVQNKRQFGFATSGSGLTSRSELYSTTLQNAAKNAGDRVRDKPLIGQILGLVRRNDRIDHEVGEHDDLVIGWLLCHWMLSQAKFLRYYGITRRVLGKVRATRQLTKEETEHMLRQDAIRARQEALYDMLASEPDEYVSLKYEQEIRHLDRQVEHSDEEVLSVDELIRQAKEAKRQKHRKPAGTGYSVYNQTNHATYDHQGVFSDEPLTIDQMYGRRPR